MSRAAPSEWTQIDLTSRRSATGQRVTAVMLAATGVIGFIVSYPALSMWWWELGLMILGCGIIVLLGIGLWINAGTSAGATVALNESGVRTSLPVVSAFETSDEGVRYQLQLRLPSVKEEFVVHGAQEADTPA